MFEQDYIMRQIREMISVIMKVLFGKEIHSADAAEVYQNESLGSLEPLCRLIDSGQIQEAERLLYESMDMKTEANLLKGYSFYQYLYGKDDDYLEAHGYSREEILAGIRRLAVLFGAGHIADLFFRE